uniref:Protein BIG GRAIN 1-like E n=1 Tax=Salix viminalis TaxID=40686 RepID=A0A6N2LTZ9_SALVM
MSITGLSSDTGRPYKKSLHRRNDSEELDVFEAARYFSGYNEAGAGCNGAMNTQKVTREDHKHSWRGGRMSLDVPMNHLISSPHAVEKQIPKEKKYKQPSSPGGRLASFLNSLFNQTSSKKKKSKSTTQSMKDGDESPGGRRKRRISISHFRSSSTTDTKSLYSSSSSGFRTPSPYAHINHAKSYKEFRSNSDHRQIVSLPEQKGIVKSMAFRNEMLDDKKNTDLSWLEEKYKFTDGFSYDQNVPKNRGSQHLEKDRPWVDQYPSEEKECGSSMRWMMELRVIQALICLELQNYDLGSYSNGLPVYETTRMDSIKRGALPISNGNL